MIEKVGKITLDYSLYPGEDLYCDGDIEQEILKIVKEYPSVDFPKIIEKKKSWPILYHLSSLRENIVEWLPIDKTMKVLEVGSGCGAITGALSQKAGEVTCIDLSKQRSLINAYRHQECDNITIHVGNFQDIEPILPCDYDYICLIGVFEYGQSYIGGEHPFEDFYRIIKKHVKKGGKIVIAIENKYGLKYWAGCREDHLGTFFSGIEGYPEGGYVRTFSKKGLESIFEHCGEKNYHFYYPYPDYKFMTTLYSHKRLPMMGELANNYRNYDRDRLQLFNEKKVYDSLIEDGMFSLFSNSFMVVIGEDINTCYVKYSNDRSEAKSVKTEIVTEEGRKKVRKWAAGKESAEHIRNIYRNYEKLSKRYEGTKVEINNCILVDGEIPYVELEYIEGATLTELFDGYLQKKDFDSFKELFREYVKRIEYGKEREISDYDLIFSNILICDDRWIVIDYEWTWEKQLDVKEIAFRSFYCYLMEDEKRNVFDAKWVYEFLGIKEEEVLEYQNKEKAFQKEVMGDRMSMAQLIHVIGGKVFKVEKWKNRIDECLQKNMVQIYEDKGEGYKEETSYYVQDAYKEENKIELQLVISNDVRKLRIDPSFRPCICKIRELQLNGKELSLENKRVISINGHMGGNTMVFATEDPNINLHLEYFNLKEENHLKVVMEISSISMDICEDLDKVLKRKIHL